MFRWCAYCVRFMGERAPWDDFAPTHGICDECLAQGRLLDPSAIARVRPIFEFHERLLAMATRIADAAELPSGSELVATGRSLHIEPIDLLMGLIQPLLYEIGRLWENGRLPPAVEARFSSLVDAMLEELVLDQRRRRRGEALGPPVFLVAAAGNRHTLGIRMLGFSLRESGVDARVVTHPVDASWLTDLARLLGATFIGVSIALPEQMRFAIEVAEHLEREKVDARLVVGGFGARGAAREGLPPRLEIHDGAADLRKANLAER